MSARRVSLTVASLVLAGLAFGSATESAQAQYVVGGYYGYGYGYCAPPPVYVAPPVYCPPPVYVAPAPVAVPYYRSYGFGGYYGGYRRGFGFGYHRWR